MLYLALQAVMTSSPGQKTKITSLVYLYRKCCVEIYSMLSPAVSVGQNRRCHVSTLCSGPVCRGADSPHWSSLPPTTVSHWPTPNSPQSGFLLGRGVRPHAWTVSYQSAAMARLPARDMLWVRCGHLRALWIIPLCFSEFIHLCN